MTSKVTHTAMASIEGKTSHHLLCFKQAITQDSTEFKTLFKVILPFFTLARFSARKMLSGRSV